MGPGGMPKRSCVPDGQYRLEPYDSPKHPQSYRLINIALGVFADYLPDASAGQYGRTRILLHTGNTAGDTEGCILVASSFGSLNNHPAVLDSHNAYDRLRSILGRMSHTIIIRPTRGTEEP